MSKSNVKSLNALSVKLGKVSDSVNKVGALKNIYAALSGKESKGITVSDVIDEITTVAEKQPTTTETTIQYGSYSILYEGNPVKFNGDITKIAVGNSAFAVCEGLKSITVPNSVTSIGNSAFRECSSLTGITIPNSVTSIEDSTFFKCTGLISIEIPEGVTSIGIYAFKDCSNLASIEIPEGVTSIGNFAFSGCTGLANIYFRGTKEQWKAITKGTGWDERMGSNVTGGTVITYNYTG